MSRGRPTTEWGAFAGEMLKNHPEYKNKDIAEAVIQHFPEVQLTEKKVRQYVANRRYLLKTVKTTESVEAF